MDNEASRRISFEYNGIFVNIETTNPTFLKFYDSNPSRTKDILLMHFCSAVGDIYSGEQLDPVLQGINAMAQEKKSLLLRRLVEEEKAQKN